MTTLLTLTAVLLLVLLPDTCAIVSTHGRERPNEGGETKVDDVKPLATLANLSNQLQEAKGQTKEEQLKMLGNLTSDVIRSINSDGYDLVSLPRKRITAVLAMRALVDAVPGDFVETGVYHGGTSLLMAQVLRVAKVTDRVLWAADSFKGFPQEDNATRQKVHAENAAKIANATEELNGTIRSNKRGSKGEFGSPRETFENNLRKNNFGHDRVQILEGWFNETLPKAPIGRISFLRLDGDLFVSTWDSLTALYSKLSPGGYIYVDDYGSFGGCKDAIMKFRQDNVINDRMYPVYEGDGKTDKTFEAVWWKKASGPASTLMRREVEEVEPAI